MEASNDHIDYDLAAKYLAGECAPVEVERFETWIDASDSNRAAFEELRALWNVDLEETNVIDTDAAWRTVDSKIDFSETASTKTSFKFYRIAAAIVLLMGIGAALWWSSGNGNRVLESGAEMATLILKDGSTVTLSPHSRLEYPETFDAQTRSVALNGQAFFEIAKDKEHPFIIVTDGGEVKVVGTAFEVNTRDDNMSLTVEVAEGIVEVSNKNLKNSARVSAGEVCSISKAQTEIEVTDIVDAAPFYWKDKTIKFRRTELKQVVQTLHDLLQLDIQLESDSIEGCELTVTFTNENPETILEIIAMTLGLDLTKNNGVYMLSGSGC
jgi:transmembrane sensor